MNITASTLYWLAGLLEGEGSFVPGSPSSPTMPRITIAMTDEDVIARVADLWGVRYHIDRTKQGHYKTPYIASIKGARAANLMRQLYPLMSKRRQQQIARALANYVDNPLRHITEDQARAIKHRLAAGERMIDISSSLNIHYEIVRTIKRGRSWVHVRED
jgi:hypothetical protein